MVHRGRVVDAQVLMGLTDLRNKMGMELSFLEDDVVSQALRIARSKSGAMTRVRRAARDEGRQRGQRRRLQRPVA